MSQRQQFTDFMKQTGNQTQPMTVVVSILCQMIYKLISGKVFAFDVVWCETAE